ncbi:LPS-assembly protein LptD [Rhodovastum atsumiense]|uniref:LPS-assembly protein LptD n=1 Tax=Rhodovastum atsumiense TaxID=504468 RepID=A0A5M6IKC6_9PROT|nr:LPS assembly protein LptD [Rhodovastum atsumiense]KAA5608700.1 LPS-assembly protein LptD [Rhodovastum atsumiense]CAH2599114.1 LPS-assembly protein LptD [Rhodovastum atsumiense]
MAYLRRDGAALRRLLLGATLAALGSGLPGGIAWAQLGALGTSKSPPISRDEPVFYQADAVEYDRDTANVILSGHVEIWQGDRVLRADRVTYDRNTGVAAAIGNVALVEPDGQVLFAEYAELSQGMRDGVLRDMRALLPENGRLAANGARRTDGTINELSRAVYTTCNLCASDPNAPPLWDIRARAAVQDGEHKQIEYHDAVVDFLGVPAMYLPFLSHPDPSQKRASGLLVPSAGYSTHLGAFASIPYYWVIDGRSDATIAPIFSSMQGGGLNLQYRQLFNNGRFTLEGSVANDNDQLGGHVFARGDFAIDEIWRWGFDINRASSQEYMRDYRIRGGTDQVLTSQVWLEGFGQGSYTRLDARAYQGLTGTVITSRLPYVLPRWQYSYFGEPDALGGRFSLDAGAFNVLRDEGTSTQRGRLSLNWDRPFTGQYGDLWNLTLHVDNAVYAAHGFTQEPNFGTADAVQSAQSMPTAAVMVRLPLARDAGDWGTQTIEPIAQLIVAPNGSKYLNTSTRIPNEDSLDQELTDANLFSLNRFPGVDRLEGGVRANVALKAGWNFPGGKSVDGLVGQSYRMQKSSPWVVGSGLENQASDIVSRVTFTPGPWVDLTARARFDPHQSMNVRFADLLASAGPSWLRFSTGYAYSSVNPYYYYDIPPTGSYLVPSGKSATSPYEVPRNEIIVGANLKLGRWSLGGSARADLRLHEMTTLAGSASYENECFIFSMVYYKRYTSLVNDSGASALLFQITLKTVGQFGFHAM